MKTCDEFQARLSAYLDGEAGDEEEGIRVHVGSCDACRKAFKRLAHVTERIRDIEEHPATLVESVLRRVREEGPRRRGRTMIPKLAAAAAILAALLWAGVLLGNGDEDAVRLSNLAAGGLSQSEQRILYGDPPTEDEWMAIILSGGSPR